MHEMGLVNLLMKTVDNILVDEPACTIQSITVEIGALSGIVLNYMDECWKAVSEVMPRYKNTELLLVPVPASVKCLDCGKVFPVDVETLQCVACQSKKLKPLSGREMTIVEVAIDSLEENKDTDTIPKQP